MNGPAAQPEARDLTVFAAERLVPADARVRVDAFITMEGGVLTCGLCTKECASLTTESYGACAQCDAEAADGRRYCKRHGGYTSQDKFLGEKKTCEVSNCLYNGGPAD